MCTRLLSGAQPKQLRRHAHRYHLGLFACNAFNAYGAGDAGYFGSAEASAL